MPLQTDKIPDSGHRTYTVDGTRHQNITCHADFMAWQVINWKTELTRHTAVCYTIHNCKCRKRKSLGFYGASAAMVTNTIFSSYFLEFFFGFPAGQHCTRDGKEPSLLGFSSVRVLQKNWGSVRYEFFASTKTVGSVLFGFFCRDKGSVLFGSIWVRETFDSFKSTDYTTKKIVICNSA